MFHSSRQSVTNNHLKSNSIKYGIKILKKKIIAYPTEAVFSIGCDPDSEIAVSRLLELKNRPIEKGLILIAADFDQLKPYVNYSILTKKQRKIVFSTWPGHVTFVFPAKSSTPYWLKGNFDSLAVRVTKHPLVIRLCRMFSKPLVSTSANLAGLPPCRTIQEVKNNFGEEFPIINGRIEGYLNPSEIRDALTGKCLRRG